MTNHATNPVKYYTFWTVLGFLNNWNNVQFSKKSTTYEDFDKCHKVVLDGNTKNMSSLVQNGKYGAVNTADLTTPGYYVVKFIS